MGYWELIGLWLAWLQMESACGRILVFGGNMWISSRSLFFRWFWKERNKRAFEGAADDDDFDRVRIDGSQLLIF